MGCAAPGLRDQQSSSNRRTNADALSRISNSLDEKAVESGIVFFTVNEIDCVVVFQLLDERVKQMKTALIEYDRDRTRRDPPVIDFNELCKFTLDDLLY